MTVMAAVEMITMGMLVFVWGWNPPACDDRTEGSEFAVVSSRRNHPAHSRSEL